MKRILTILLCITGIFATMRGADSGAELLERTAAKIKAAKSLSVDFSMNSDGHLMHGKLTLAGKCFTLVSPEARSWYDGKTQWTYSGHMGEVNITEPTEGELSQVNPFEIVKSFNRDYTSKTIKSPSGTKAVRLTAKDKTQDISQATVTVNDTTGYPSEIDFTLSNGQKITVKILDIKEGGPLKLSRFRFYPGDYPGVRVVDLR